MEVSEAESLLADKTLSPADKSKKLLGLKKDQLKQCVIKRNLSASGNKPDLVREFCKLSSVCKVVVVLSSATFFRARFDTSNLLLVKKDVQRKRCLHLLSAVILSRTAAFIQNFVFLIEA